MSTRVRTEVEGLELVLTGTLLEFVYHGSTVVTIGIGEFVQQRLTEMFALKDQPACNFFDHVLALAAKGLQAQSTTT